MRKILFVVLSLSMLVSACGTPTTDAPAATQPPQGVLPVFDAPTQSQEMTDLESAVADELAKNLGVNKKKISVVSNEEVEFGDACLDIPFQDVTCAQTVTPGRVVVLAVDGVEYEYHTSLSGNVVHPATIALVWSRDGGFAGFCDRLTVFLSGEVYGMNCRSQPGDMVGSMAESLTPEQRAQFAEWVATFEETVIDASDPAGVADGMSVKLTLYGTGSKTPSEADQVDFFNWVQELHAKLYS